MTCRRRLFPKTSLRPGGWIVVGMWILGAGFAQSPLPVVDSCPAAPAFERPLPSAEAIADGLLRQGSLDRSNKLAFNSAYAYTTVRRREVRNPAGVLKEKSISRKDHDPVRQGAGELVEVDDVDLDEPPRDRSYQERDFKVTRDLIDRFDFLPLGREERDGLALCKVAFRPRPTRLPEPRFVDRFINRTAGVLWLDDRDYTLVRAQIWLTDEIGVAAGILGKVHSLESLIERQRTPEGYWYTRSIHWQVDFRKLFTRRQVDFTETLEDLRHLPGSP